MASNGFFEFLGDLKGLYDEASRRRDWAKQYNPYNGGNAWFRGLGAINQMMDRNAEDRALKAQRQAYKAGTDDAPTNTFIGADSNGVYGMGQSEPSVSIGVSAIPPQSGNGFSSIFGGNDFNGGGLVNPPIPSTSSSSDSLAQRVEGQNNASARDLSRYLSNDYNMANWMQADAERGVDNPYISALRYGTKIAPLVEGAKNEELRNAFFTLQNPEATDQDRLNAIATIQYYKGDPYMEENQQMKRDQLMYNQGYIRNRDISNIGGNVLSALGDYEEGEQWMSPDGTGDSRTQCSNWVSDVLRKAGLKGIGSPNGDKLMAQFGKAYHEGLDGIQAGDVLNFKDHVGIYAGNGQYVARNSSGGVHQGSMEEAIKYFGQPLGYGSVREFANTNMSYLKDPNRVSQREKFNAEQAYRDKALRIREQRVNGTSPSGKTKNQQSFTKNVVEQRKAASELAKISSAEEPDEKEYDKKMNEFAKSIDGIYGAYDLDNRTDLSTMDCAIGLYDELSKTKSGLSKESLAEGVARAVYARRGDVSAEDLQRKILEHIALRNRSVRNPKEEQKPIVNDQVGNDAGTNLDKIRQQGQKRGVTEEPWQYQGVIKNAWDKALGNFERGRNIR